MGRVKTNFPRIVNGEYCERVWGIELYPDTSLYNCTERINAIVDYCNNNNVAYGYILHDKDVDSDGVIKKAHYHFILNFPNPRKQNALSALFLVPYNYFKCWDSFEKGFQYLIHLNDRNKYQYPITDIITNVSNVNDLLLNKVISEEIAIQKILDFINGFDNSVKVIDIQDVMQFALKNHIYTHLRRSGSLFSCLFARSRYYERD